jgi:putative membrane protein
MMLLFWAAIILLVVWAVRSVFPSQRQGEHESAIEILKRRYAAGEISQAEYEQARKALGDIERANEDVVAGGRK